jgi:uncharacterized membrane protein YtjA (UPF0391 family)
MNMEKAVIFACWTFGILLLIVGASITPSLETDVSRFLSGSLTGLSVWIMLAGLVLLIIGVMEALKRKRRGWWDNLNSPLPFLIIALLAGLKGFSSDNASLTTSLAEVFCIISVVLFFVSLLQSSRR